MPRSKRKTRVLLIAAAVVAIATATVPTTRGAGFVAPPCKPAETVVWLALEGDSAAGSSYVTLELTNLSKHVCTLYGYPAVSAVDLSGRQVGAAADRDRAATAKDVQLAPGEAAQAPLRIAHVGAYPPATCRPVQAAGLRVYLPAATQPKVVPFPFGACSRVGLVFLHVRAVRAS